MIGDIDEARLGRLLDEVFGGLADKPYLAKVADVKPAAGTIKVIDMPVPQFSLEDAAGLVDLLEDLYLRDSEQDE